MGYRFNTGHLTAQQNAIIDHKEREEQLRREQREERERIEREEKLNNKENSGE
ncbi:hypothetical protein [Clostridium chrysemydis]|uniref:hypothetical protein n=1 Tax=Clostridium chrysemydis TaxID=2665504 RepID=UPI001883C976|nr:hypothetical protein [Clostridium chrysemydis]